MPSKITARELGSWMLVLCGSGVDAMVILGFNVLTAAQTGNTILFSVAIARGDFVTGLASAVSIAAFVCGAFGGGWLCQADRIRVALAVQAGCLLVALGLWLAIGAVPAVENPIVAVAALAMGIQSAVIARIHGHPGTYITGLLTTFAVALSAPRRSDAPSAGLQGLVWVIYVCGAIATGLLYRAVGPAAMLLPLAALAAALLLLSPEGARSASPTRR